MASLRTRIVDYLRVTGPITVSKLEKRFPVPVGLTSLVEWMSGMPTTFIQKAHPQVNTELIVELGPDAEDDDIRKLRRFRSGRTASLPLENQIASSNIMLVQSEPHARLAALHLRLARMISVRVEEGADGRPSVVVIASLLAFHGGQFPIEHVFFFDVRSEQPRVQESILDVLKGVFHDLASSRMVIVNEGIRDMKLLQSLLGGSKVVDTIDTLALFSGLATQDGKLRESLGLQPSLRALLRHFGILEEAYDTDRYTKAFWDQRPFRPNMVKLGSYRVCHLFRLAYTIMASMSAAESSNLWTAFSRLGRVHELLNSYAQTSLLRGSDDSSTLHAMQQEVNKVYALTFTEDGGPEYGHLENAREEIPRPGKQSSENDDVRRVAMLAPIMILLPERVSAIIRKWAEASPTHGAWVTDLILLPNTVVLQGSDGTTTRFTCSDEDKNACNLVERAREYIQSESADWKLSPNSVSSTSGVVYSHERSGHLVSFQSSAILATCSQSSAYAVFQLQLPPDAHVPLAPLIMDILLGLSEPREGYRRATKSLVVLFGAKRTGKSTLLRQAISSVQKSSQQRGRVPLRTLFLDTDGMWAYDESMLSQGTGGPRRIVSRSEDKHQPLDRSAILMAVDRVRPDWLIVQELDALTGEEVEAIGELLQRGMPCLIGVCAASLTALMDAECFRALSTVLDWRRIPGGAMGFTVVELLGALKEWPIRIFKTDAVTFDLHNEDCFELRGWSQDTSMRSRNAVARFSYDFDSLLASPLALNKSHDISDELQPTMEALLAEDVIPWRCLNDELFESLCDRGVRLRTKSGSKSSADSEEGQDSAAIGDLRSDQAAFPSSILEERDPTKFWDVEYGEVDGFEQSPGIGSSELPDSAMVMAALENGGVLGDFLEQGSLIPIEQEDPTSLYLVGTKEEDLWPSYTESEEELLRALRLEVDTLEFQKPEYQLASLKLIKTKLPRSLESQSADNVSASVRIDRESLKRKLLLGPELMPSTAPDFTDELVQWQDAGITRQVLDDDAEADQEGAFLDSALTALDTDDDDEGGSSDDPESVPTVTVRSRRADEAARLLTFQQLDLLEIEDSESDSDDSLFDSSSPWSTEWVFLSDNEEDQEEDQEEEVRPTMQEGTFRIELNDAEGLSSAQQREWSEPGSEKNPWEEVSNQDDRDVTKTESEGNSESWEWAEKLENEAAEDDLPFKARQDEGFDVGGFDLGPSLSRRPGTSRLPGSETKADGDLPARESEAQPSPQKPRRLSGRPRQNLDFDEVRKFATLDDDDLSEPRELRKTDEESSPAKPSE
ncbi:hypothetical protein FVE85_5637 [Porphyridium purpureum]|uniref:Uncharacterized protein n=1 Tax=Porphyridium purpureum TaxID=35688 RepID=A0A5J4Z4G9_PORPP|nr:hypothetical protein FVE85_5637 [Porphyridium purpureum]|eukprot:POR6105..scf295_1